MGHRSNDESSALDPAAIAEQRFPVRFRGYDRAAVAHHLARAAAAHQAALDAAATAEAALAARPEPEPVVANADADVPVEVDDEPSIEEVEDAVSVVDEPDLAQRFGDDLAEVVRTTRARVVELEADAARRAEEAVTRAEQQAARIVQAAQARADHLTAVHDRLVARLVDARAELADVLDRLDGARLDVRADDAPVEAVIDLSESEIDLAGEHHEGEDDPAFDRMVRDALERAVRLGRAHSDDA